MSVFNSNNEALELKEYFPTYLSKLGTGNTFEQRVVSGVESLGFLPKGSTILELTDEGGWESMDRLTASIHLKYGDEDETHELKLLGSALVTIPPITPKLICERVWRNVLGLRELELKHSVVSARDGVIIHLGLNSIKYSDKLPTSALDSLAYFAALIDGGYQFEPVDISQKVSYTYGGENQGLNQFSANSFVSKFGMFDNVPVWMDLDFETADANSSTEIGLQALLGLVPNDNQGLTLQMYRAYKSIITN